jgi:hypothetical protein
MVREVHIQLDVTLPGISDDWRRVPKQIAEATFEFTSGDKKRICDITKDDVAKQSGQICAIQDRGIQFSHLLSVFQYFVEIIRISQKLAESHLEIAVALDRTRKQLALLDLIDIDKISPESGPEPLG